MNIICPLPATFTAIPLSTCPFKFDQIVRLGLQRRQTGASTFADATDLATLATWQALIAAGNTTAILMTPLFAGFVIPQSTELKSGGNDNSTFNGIPNYHGEGSVTATGTFRNLNPASKKAMKDLSMFSLATGAGASNLTLFFINKDRYIYYIDLNASIYGTEVYNFRIGSRGTEGLNTDDINGFGFDLPPDWDDDLKVVQPNFDPLSDI